MELRRHAGLEDGDLEREVAVAQQAAAVRATFELRGRVCSVRASRLVDVSVFLRATRSEQQCDGRKGQNESVRSWGGNSGAGGGALDVGEQPLIARNGSDAVSLQ